MRYTVIEYAKAMGVSRQAVYSKINRGTLKTIVIDNVQYIDTEEEISLQSTQSKVNVKTTSNKHSTEDNSSYLTAQIQELKEELKQVKEELAQERKLNRKLNKQLNKTKDSSIDILTKFIGEMKQLSYTKSIEQR